MASCGMQNRYPASRVVKSSTIAWSASSAGNDIPLDFLDPVLSAMGDNGRVTAIDLRLSTAVTTAAASAALERLYPRAITRFLCNDRYGTRVDLSGASLRCVNYVEVPNYSATMVKDLGASVSPAQTVITWLHIPVEPLRAVRPQDYRWNLRDLRAGKMQVDWAAATLGEVAANQCTISSGNLQVWVTCIDEGKNELKSRMILRDFAIVAQQQTFPIRGALRYALQYIGEVGESAATPSVWPTQNISSIVLQLYSVTDDWFQQYYRAKVWPRKTATSLTDDEQDPTMYSSATAIAYSVLPIFPPGLDSGLTEMPLVAGFDWSTDQAFGVGTFVATNKPRMILCYVEDRPGDSCGGGGATKTADGRLIPVKLVNPAISKKLPAVAVPSGPVAGGPMQGAPNYNAGNNLAKQNFGGGDIPTIG